MPLIYNCWTRVDLRFSTKNHWRSRKARILFIMTREKNRFTATNRKHSFWELRILPEWRMWNVFSSCPIRYMWLTFSANGGGARWPSVKSQDQYVPKLMSNVTKSRSCAFYAFQKSILQFKWNIIFYLSHT